MGSYVPSSALAEIRAKQHYTAVLTELAKRKSSGKTLLLRKQALENYMPDSSFLANDDLATRLERALEKHCNLDDAISRSLSISTNVSLRRFIPTWTWTQMTTAILVEPEMPFDHGLKEDGQTLCIVCNEVLANDTNAKLITLPCLHVFHLSCIADWLESDIGNTNWNCPCCRASVPDGLGEYE